MYQRLAWRSKTHARQDDAAEGPTDSLITYGHNGKRILVSYSYFEKVDILPRSESSHRAHVRSSSRHTHINELVARILPAVPFAY